MFSFNMRGKRHLIGNVQLTPEKYAELKAKLTEELANELEKKKRLLNLCEMIPKGKPNKPPSLKPASISSKSNVKEDIRPIEKAFAETSGILFGKQLDMRTLENYLMENVRRVNSMPSCISNRNVYYFDMGYDRALASTGRLIKLDEQDRISAVRDWPAGTNADNVSFSKIKELLDTIAFFCPEIEMQSSNMIECPSIQNAHDGYRSCRVYFTKYSAFCFWPRDSDHVFGCDSIRDSSFCIKCYNSYKLTRCFEADTSQNCSDSYFIHNCENVHDSMFCSNAKNLRYAIGNAEIGREKFIGIKKLVLGSIVHKLEKDRRISQSIYNIGTGK
jgi:hypothetical protein